MRRGDVGDDDEDYDEEVFEEEEEEVDVEVEEDEKVAEEDILLRMNFSINAGADPDSALDAVRKYVRSFPFAAVLPVQPLTYLPSEDAKGVKVTFLRKKTKEKGSEDGDAPFEQTARKQRRQCECAGHRACDYPARGAAAA